jgi:hypothetical protein
MNDIDFLRDDLIDLEHRVNDLIDNRPYYMYGRKGQVKKCIAVFSDLYYYREFVKKCELKSPKKGERFKKNSPLYYWDEIIMKREYIPEHLFFNPNPEDFKVSGRIKGTITEDHEEPFYEKS